MKLSYREFGEGKPIMILHGLYGSSDNWVSIGRELSDEFRVVIPDMRNHGNSPHTSIHTYEAMSDDILELADLIGLDKFIIAGHSMGGKTALWFAKKWPERVSGLIVLDMSPFRADPSKNPSLDQHMDILRLMNEIDPAKLASRDEAEERFISRIPSERITGFLLKNLARDEKGGFKWKLNPRYLLDNIDNIMEGLERKEYPDISMRGFPVLFLRAENSGYINDEDLKGITNLFPAAEIITVMGTSHWLHAEKPELITGYIRDFAS